MNEELKQLIEDAAKLLSLPSPGKFQTFLNGKTSYTYLCEGDWEAFDPLDPERGDLWKVADSAELCINYEFCIVVLPCKGDGFNLDEYEFTKGDYQSLALAILRAASAVYKSRRK